MKFRALGIEVELDAWEVYDKLHSKMIAAIVRKDAGRVREIITEMGTLLSAIEAEASERSDD